MEQRRILPVRRAAVVGLPAHQSGGNASCYDGSKPHAAASSIRRDIKLLISRKQYLHIRNRFGLAQRFALPRAEHSRWQLSNGPKHVRRGTNQLVVAIVDGSGAPLAGNVDTKLKLSDAPEIVETLKISGGQATFSNVPGRTVIVEAQAPDNSSGTAGAYGGDGTVKLQVFKFNQPDPVDNNDVSQGLSGHEYGSSPVTLIPHIEEVGPAKQPPASMGASVMSASRAVRYGAARQRTATAPAAAATPAAAGDNMDASLSTLGEGPQKMSRTFTIKPGTSSVSVRYRFMTSEVPGGYFGSEYNDYFAVTIRSKSGGGITESNTMNGLGCGFSRAGPRV